MHRNDCKCEAGFVKAEDGAVTVDWVVLTAAIVAFAAIVIYTVTGSVPGLSDKISAQLDSYQAGVTY